MSSWRPLLWITPKWPLPADDGAKRATLQLVSALVREGCVIDLLALAAVPPGAPGVDELLRTHRVRRAWAAENLARATRAVQLGSWVAHPALPITVAGFAREQAAIAVRERLEAAEGDGYDVVYDGLHGAAHAADTLGRFRCPEGARRVFYRAHNFESDIWGRKAQGSRGRLAPAKKAFFYFQQLQVRAFELSLVRAAHGVAAVSDEDSQRFFAEVPRARLETVPIGFEFPPVREFPTTGTAFPLLFLGRLDWPPNREGLIWFLKEVWPVARARRSELALTIAGSGDPGPITGLAGESAGARFLGRVEAVEPLYAEHALSLAPIFYGSGTRVKVIEAARLGRACLSTAIGVEGTGLRSREDYLHAETAEEWVRALEMVTLTQAAMLGRSSWRKMREEFDSGSAARRFLRLLDDPVKTVG